MKRKMLLFVLALTVIVCQNAQAQTSSRLVGKTHLVNNGASFTPVDSTNYVYSGNRGGDLKHALKYDNSTTWDYLGDTAYSNAYTYLQTFDANNNLLSSIYQYWSGTAWILSTKNLYYYDTSGKETAMIQQSWGGTAWVPVSQDVYTYVSGKMVEDQYQLWNSLTTSFSASSQKNYYYDPVSGNEINVTNITWVSGVPVNQNENTYTYNTANQLLTNTYSNWNGAAWVSSTMTTNTYDTTGNMINALYQTYDTATSSWVNNTLQLFSNFNSNHNPQTDVQQLWDTAAGGSWNNQIQYTYTYNSYNQMLTSIGQSWNIVGAFEFALNDPMINYYYQTYSSASNVAVNNVVAELDNAAVYPVPAKNMLHVNLNWTDAQTATIAIYDMQGRVVNQWQSDYGTQYFSAISVDHLAPGTYFVKINGANGQIVKQFVVAH